MDSSYPSLHSETPIQRVWRPFEEGVCEMTSRTAQVDPRTPLSLEAIISLASKGRLSWSEPWAALPDVGFETRFHGHAVSNLKPEPLPVGFSRGNFLFNLPFERVSWLRHPCHLLADVARGDLTATRVADFFKASVGDFDWASPEAMGSDDPLARGEIKVNGEFHQIAVVTRIGCVVNVVSAVDGSIRPCEVPLGAPYLDWIGTSRLCDPPVSATLGQNWIFAAISRLWDQCPEDRLVSHVRSRLARGHGLLAVLILALRMFRDGERSSFPSNPDVAQSLLPILPVYSPLFRSADSINRFDKEGVDA